MHIREFAAAILVVTTVTGLFIFSPTGLSLTSKVAVRASGRIVADYNIQPLHVEGSYITDDQGHTIYLRGVNYGGFNNYPDGWWVSQGGTMQEHFSAMQSWGMNVIRYTLTMAWWTRNDGDIRQHLRDAVVAMQDYGLYAILAPWRYDTGTGQMGDPLDHMTLNEYVNWWIDVLDVIDSPNIIVDPCNEPLASESSWQNTIQQLVNGIRAAGHDHLILYQRGYGTGVNKRIRTWYENYPISDPAGNLVIGTHLYQSGYGYSSDYDTLKSEMQTAQINEIADVLNMPLLVGEIGASSDSERIWFDNCLTILNEWNLGWAVWIWNAGVSWAVREGTSFNPSANGQILLDHLI